MSIPELNIPLLRKIQERILQEPRDFLMRTWVIRGTPGCHYTGDSSGDEPLVEFSSCGTAACIGGWAMLLNGRGVTNSIDQDAAILLGLEIDNEPHKTSKLFNAHNWDLDLKRAYFKAGQSLECKAKIAVEMIDRVIDRYNKKKEEEKNHDACCEVG